MMSVEPFLEPEIMLQPPPTLLTPGCYLVEVEFSRPVILDNGKMGSLLPWLDGIGFTNITIDESLQVGRPASPRRILPRSSRREDVIALETFATLACEGSAEATLLEVPATFAETETEKDLRVLLATFQERWVEWGRAEIESLQPPAPGQKENQEKTYRTRFVAHLTKPIGVIDKGGVRWLYASPIAIDPYGDLRPNIEPFALTPGQVYELRFHSRMKRAATRDTVTMMLAATGFRPLKLSALKRNIRLPDRPGADYTLWYAVGRWECPYSYITSADDCIFDDVQAVRGSGGQAVRGDDVQTIEKTR